MQPDPLAILVERLRKELHADPNHQLTLYHQRLVWRTLAIGEDDAATVIRAYRRIALETQAVELVLPKWDRAYPHDDLPHDLLQHALLLSAGQVDIRDARELYAYYVTDWMEQSYRSFPYLHIAEAASRVLSGAIYAHQEPELFDVEPNPHADQEREYSFDEATPSELCADVFAGGEFPEPFNGALLRLEFWNAWLDCITDD